MRRSSKKGDPYYRFRAAHLPNDKLAEILKEISSQYEESMCDTKVYDSQLPASIAAMRTHPLNDIQRIDLSRYHLWLGESINIDEVIALELSKEERNNLLIIGKSQEGIEGAKSLAMFSLISIISNDILRKTKSKIYLFDFIQEGFFEEIPAYQKVKENIEVNRNSEDIMRMILELQQEVAKRKTNPAPREKIFILMTGFQRARQLQRQTSNNAPLIKAFLEILEDGPVYEIYTIVVTNNFSTVNGKLSIDCHDYFDFKILVVPTEPDQKAVFSSYRAEVPERYMVYMQYYGDIKKFRYFEQPSIRWYQRHIRKLERNYIS